jgi:hypothetical protein
MLMGVFFSSIGIRYWRKSATGASLSEMGLSQSLTCALSK